MPFDTARVVHRLFESLTVGRIERAVGALQHIGTFLLNTCAEAMDVAGHLDLLTKRKILNLPDDRFDNCHSSS